MGRKSDRRLLQTIIILFCLSTSIQVTPDAEGSPSLGAAVIRITMASASQQGSTEKRKAEARGESGAARPIGEEFTVQVAALADQSIAKELAESLREQGFPAYVLNGENFVAWRVRVGPYANRNNAEKAAGQLKSRRGLPTWIIQIPSGSPEGKSTGEITPQETVNTKNAQPGNTQKGAAPVGNIAEKFSPSWRFHGSNTMRYDYIVVTGDKTASPYPYYNSQFYNQFDINFHEQFTPYSFWRGQVVGAYNESDYRSPYKNIVPERLSIFHENGDFAIPYRAEIGDFFGFLSLRTFQRSLKGIQIEFQPQYDPGRQHSIQFFSGANQPAWRDFTLANDYNNGLSYLVGDSQSGTWSLNFLHNSREGKSYLGTLDRSQFVVSLANENKWEIAEQDITTSIEISGFSGDHDGIGNAINGQNRDDFGIYAQLAGKSRIPLTYRFRFERYGRDYRPAGAVVSPDRRTIEGHLGWRFDSGLLLKFREQNFVDDLESANPTDTDVFGISLSGPFFKETLNNLNGSIDAYVQDVENRNSTINSFTSNATVNLSKPLHSGWNGRLGFFFQHLNDQTLNSPNNTTIQANLALDHPLDFYGITGLISPGLAIRQVYNNPASRSSEFFPTLAFNLRKERHQLDFSTGYNQQDRPGTINPDIGTFNFNANYQYHWNNHGFGVEFFMADREPRPGTGTESYKIGCYYTFHFDKPAAKIVSPRRTLPPSKVAKADPLPSQGPLDLAELRPGISMKTVRERLKRGGISGPVELGRLFIYEERLLDEVDQRQRLVLVKKGGKLEMAALIIEFDDVGNLEEYQQTFLRVQAKLLKLYGKPANALERGNFGQNLVDGVNERTFIRLYEWDLPGGTMRFGIPRRMDRRIRMEIHFSRDFPNLQETLWSLEEVR